MKLIVGLGNPGREYVGTRHNIGFDVIDSLAYACSATSSASDFDRVARNRFDALTLDAESKGGNQKLLLMKPITFMNLSGKSVQQAMAFYRLEATDIMVVLDDVALPIGKLRMRAGGSSGGHNGLKDIERMIGTSQYPRLRIGVDAPGRIPQRDYVLGKWSPDQKKALEFAVPRACDAIGAWVTDGIETAMNRFNAGDAIAGNNN
jgi:PTH1 family peptidyl-tRNA hydrolase